eukprot:339702-Pelagomonas_calceolata.AAC.1
MPTFALPWKALRSSNHTPARTSYKMGKRCSAPIAHMCLQNIRYGCLDASDDDVIKAAEAACIHEAITTRFPRGYDTVDCTTQANSSGNLCCWYHDNPDTNKEKAESCSKCRRTASLD